MHIRYRCTQYRFPAILDNIIRWKSPRTCRRLQQSAVLPSRTCIARYSFNRRALLHKDIRLTCHDAIRRRRIATLGRSLVTPISLVCKVAFGVHPVVLLLELIAMVGLDPGPGACAGMRAANRLQPSTFPYLLPRATPQSDRRRRCGSLCQLRQAVPSLH